MEKGNENEQGRHDGGVVVGTLRLGFEIEDGRVDAAEQLLHAEKGDVEEGKVTEVEGAEGKGKGDNISHSEVEREEAGTTSDIEVTEEPSGETKEAVPSVLCQQSWKTFPVAKIQRMTEGPGGNARQVENLETLGDRLPLWHVAVKNDLPLTSDRRVGEVARQSSLGREVEKGNERTPTFLQLLDCHSAPPEVVLEQSQEEY